MKVKQVSAALIATILSASTLAAPITLKFWHSDSDDKIHQLTEEFNATHKGDIVVEDIYTGNYATIIKKLTASLPAKRNPDLAMLEVTQYGLFAENGVLTDLSSMFDNSETMHSELQPFALEIGNYKQGNYLVPFNSSTPLMYVNKRLLRQAGYNEIPTMKTLAQILEVAKKVQANAKEGEFALVEPGQFARFGLVMQNGGDFVDPVTNESRFDHKGTIEAYAWMAKVKQLGLTSVDTITNEKIGKKMFAEGRMAIQFQSTGNLTKFTNLGDDLLVLPMPCSVECRTPVGGAGIGIISTVSEDKKQAAWTYLSFMTNQKSSANWAKATGYMPVNKTVLNLPETKKLMNEQPGYKVALEQLPIAQGRARPPEMAWIRTQEKAVFQAIALGSKSPEQAMNEFHEIVTERLTK